ncbi:hypothetical protein NX784_07580 [Massilia pinisoli]|uniref:Lipoprotein n=1 Tax=Massilia pinisoli TaxID=1772194 RepID=A0ABT1ZNH4_9BURK|nr:hypothetical protein [Massilia pinisoli]MCS0581447.1 hypothetical protein [Massilia pinisoli]
MLIQRSHSIHALVTLAAMAALVGCASPGDHDRHHADGADSTMAATGGTMSTGATGSAAGCGMMTDCAAAQGQPMDKDAMCAMYRDMQNAPNDQARQAMMDRRMQGMSPEMRQRHMDMMRQQCQ